MNTETQMSIEERRKLIAAQQAVLAAEEADLVKVAQVRAQAERNQKIKDEIAKEEAKKTAIFSAIEAQVRRVTGWEADLVVDGSTFTYKGKYTIWISLTQKSEGSKWHSRYVPESYYVFIGNYSDRTKYPPKKDNTHSYDKIAACVIGNINDAVRKDEALAKAKATAEANLVSASVLQAEFSLREYGPYTVKPSQQVEGNVILKMPEYVTLTPEQARKVLTLLKEFGKIA